MLTHFIVFAVIIASSLFNWTLIALDARRRGTHTSVGARLGLACGILGMLLGTACGLGGLYLGSLQ